MIRGYKLEQSEQPGKYDIGVYAEGVLSEPSFWILGLTHSQTKAAVDIIAQTFEDREEILTERQGKSNG